LSVFINPTVSAEYIMVDNGFWIGFILWFKECGLMFIYLLAA